MDLGSQGGGFLGCAEELGGFGALDVFYFLVIEEADGGTAPYYPIPVVL